MSTEISLNNVFKTQGQPNITYVKQCEGQFEDDLSFAIDNKGTICLLTGPSKTGKTTLYKTIAKQKNLEPLQVRCDIRMTEIDLWKKALERVNFDQINTITQGTQGTSRADAELSGQLGWSWLAGVAGKASTGISSTDTETIIRTKVLSAPSPEHLVPILKELPYILVIEDIHYLEEEIQKVILQQWKTFVDNEISIIVVGTTHRAGDLIRSNPDLSTRVRHIDLPGWEAKDLRMIVSQGVKHLGIENFPETLTDTIAKESAGLPMLTQAICLQLFHTIQQYRKTLQIDNYNRQDVFDALYKVATTQTYSQIYNRLALASGDKVKSYNVYELVLSTFSLEPLKFSVTLGEINERLSQLKSLTEYPIAIPSRTAVSTMLKGLAGSQERLKINLLEWNSDDQRLYILEPTFLFYLRWRQPRATEPTLGEIFADLFELMSST